MALEPIEIFAGVSGIIWVSISTILGLIIASKYFKYKKRVFLLVGLTWILLAAPWWSSTTSFLVALQTDVGLPPEIYFTMTFFSIPIGLIIWMTAFTDLLYKEKQKIILLIVTIEGVLFYIYFFVSLSIDPKIIGVLNGAVDSDYRSVVLIYTLSTILIVLFSGIQFARNSLRSDDPEMRLKGKLLIVAFISFTIGAVMDSAIPLNFVTLPITRIILISSAIEFYGGFILPNWMKKLLLKQR